MAISTFTVYIFTFSPLVIINMYGFSKLICLLYCVDVAELTRSDSPNDGIENDRCMCNTH